MADKQEIVDVLNHILEMELAGAVHYTHYSFMVFGFHRIPIVKWMEGQADESLVHARKAGEMVTLLGAHPSLKVGPLLESHRHDIGDILRESLEHERKTLLLYQQLLRLTEGANVMLEEYAREQIYAEELHIGEVDKMLRRPGEIAAFSG
jgi:bacterioferritin